MAQSPEPDARVDDNASTLDHETAERGGAGSVDLSSPAVPVDSLEEMLARAVEAPATFPTLTPGTLVGDRYEIERVLGAGGMGTVYVAHDRSLDRRVALKLHRSSTAADRLHREAIAMARLAHRNVVTVYEVDTYEGRTFVAMEYIAGANLRVWVAAAQRSWREIVDVLCEAGEGLAAAHDAGLVHRDVKPDNIFIGEDGRVCIGDFGLALLPRGETPEVGRRRPITGAVVKAPPTGPATMTGALMGTPLYMSPEQILGEPLDARTDQFAFAVAAWEAVCGVRPYKEGKTVDDLHDAIVDGVMVPPKRRVPARIRRVLLRGLAADARARWPSVRDLIRALRSAVRRPRVIAAVAGGALVAGAVAAWALWPARDAEASCDDAGAEVHAIVPPELVDRLVGEHGGDGGPRLLLAAQQLRQAYGEQARCACVGELTGKLAAQLAAATRDCLDHQALRFRELMRLGAATATPPGDLLPIVARGAGLAVCADPAQLERWPARAAVHRNEVLGMHARIDAASELLAAGRLQPARELRDQATEVAPADASGGRPASPPGVVLLDESLRLRMLLLRGRLARAEADLVLAHRTLETVHRTARAGDHGELALLAGRDLIDVNVRDRRDPASARRYVDDGLADADRLRRVYPDEAVGLLVAAANAAVETEEPDRAIELLDRAAALVSPRDDVRRLEVLEGRAAALAAKGKSDESFDAQATVIAALRELLGPSHARVAEATAVQAEMLLDASRVAKATVALREAERLLVGASAGATAAAAETTVALLLYRLGEPGAEAHFTRARALRVAQLGEAHPEVARLDTSLARIVLDRGELQPGLALLRRASAAIRHALGPNHPLLAETLYAQAVAERRSGSVASALETAQRCAAIYERTQTASARHAVAVAHVAALQNQRTLHEEALASATLGLALDGSKADPGTSAWLRLEAGRALVELKRDPARARRLLMEARFGYELTGIRDRFPEIDGLLAALR